MKQRTVALVVAVVVGAVVLPGCTAHPPTKASASAPATPVVVKPSPVARPHPETKAKRPAAPRKRHLTAASLRSYGGCRPLVRALRREGLKEVTAYGLNQWWGGLGMPAMGVGLARTDAAAPGSAPASMPATAYSGTNNQEADVDEPDSVKTNGELMVIASAVGGRVRVIDVSGPRPRQRSEITPPNTALARLLLIGTDVVVLTTEYGANGPSTSAEVVSLLDPDHPRVVRTFTVDGSLMDARLVHGRVLLVTQSNPQLPFTYPLSGSPAAVHKALETNQAVIRRATRAQLLPSVRVTPGGHRYRSACSATLHPGTPSGIGSTTVTTIDPSKAAPTQTLTVTASGGVVYASTTALYLATTSWQAQMATDSLTPVTRTNLHGFDISHPDSLSYLGSGTVRGTLVDQYSMSEHGGYLRVATTVGQPTPANGEGTTPVVPSDNRVTILQPQNGALVRVGQVRGLGRGERIYGVRFLGDLGYVVTFRQIDPLFVLDLSNPRSPRLKGQLEVTGYSSALYPLGNDQLLGVGQSVDGHQHPTGAQVSVFDVHQVSHPALLSRQLFPNGSSAAQDDHHSLLWWPANRLLVVPVTTYTQNRFDAESVVFRVSPAGVLSEAGRVPAPDAGSEGDCCPQGATRTVVVGDLLYSVSDRGLTTTPMDRLDAHAWYPFA